MLKHITVLLMKVTPKFNYCFIKGMPTYEDSLVALYEKLPIEKVDKVIWSCYDTSSVRPFEDRGKTVYVKKGSIREFFYGVVSKYVLTTHGHFVPVITQNQICVNIWHGMPLKGIGKLDGQPSRQDTYLCSTSKLFQDIMARAFEMPLERTMITGIPRNDLLLSDRPEEIWEKAGIDRTAYDKVFFWLPTYRKSVLGYLTENGVEVDNIFNMVDFPTAEFQAFLAENRCLCIIKPHPMAPVKESLDYANILVVDENWLWEHDLTLYPLVGQTDFLVSDISSVIVDYMLIDKPIIICFEDSEQYKASRSVVFDPLEDWLPSEIIHSYEHLKVEILNCCNGEDRNRDKRHYLTDKFHRDKDFKSTERVLELVWK